MSNEYFADTHESSSTDIRTVAFVSLGCPKNLIDSEKMLGRLTTAGSIPASDENDADALEVNTRSFIETAKDESLEVLEEAAQRRRNGELKRLIVAGCLSQRYREKLLQWCPEIDAMVGVFDRDRIVEAVQGSKIIHYPENNTPLPIYSSIAPNAATAAQDRNINPVGYFESDSARLRLTLHHYTYLRVSEGCNQGCSFCTIPLIRGKMRSKPLDTLLGEARELMNDGAFELILIGEDTTSYGSDLDDNCDLCAMLTQLNALAESNGGAWLRLMYAYPSFFTDEMIDTIAQLQNVIKYIDLPLQHINDRILDSMRRKTTRREIENLLIKLRDRMPDITIRTTLISGFPGETDEEHRELVEFIEQFSFDNMGVFPFSPEEGTAAWRLWQNDPVEDIVVAERIEELMLTQQNMVFDRNADLAHNAAEFAVLIDGQAQSNTPIYIGRTYQQAPEVDSVTYVQSHDKLMPGEIVLCKIVNHSNYDLIAQPSTNTNIFDTEK